MDIEQTMAEIEWLGRIFSVPPTHRTTTKFVSGDGVAVAEEILPGVMFRKGFDHMLARPFRGGMFGDTEM